VIISHERKFIFFSFPKTGSESVREMFADLNEETVTPYKDATTDRPWYSHMSPAAAEAAFAARGWDIRDYFTFTVTRNPYARMVSIYEMVMSVDGIERLKQRIGFGRRSFGDWLEATSPNGAGAGGRTHQRWRKFGTWSTEAWCAGADGAPLVSKVLRLEHLADELPEICTQLGVAAPQQMTHKNRRVSKDWRDYYDARSHAIVTERYANDIAAYGYDWAFEDQLNAQA